MLFVSSTMCFMVDRKKSKTIMDNDDSGSLLLLLLFCLSFLPIAIATIFFWTHTRLIIRTICICMYDANSSSCVLLFFFSSSPVFLPIDAELFVVCKKKEEKWTSKIPF